MVATRVIEQTVSFKASPHDVYEALMDSAKHAEFTGAPATISREIGGEFSIMGGALSGKNIELVPDQKIVQSWRSNDWPEGHLSTVSFALEADNNGTRLSLTHAGVPDDSYDDVQQGWHDYYCSKMKELLEN